MESQNCCSCFSHLLLLLLLLQELVSLPPHLTLQESSVASSGAHVQLPYLQWRLKNLKILSLPLPSCLPSHWLQPQPILQLKHLLPHTSEVELRNAWNMWSLGCGASLRDMTGE